MQENHPSRHSNEQPRAGPEVLCVELPPLPAESRTDPTSVNRHAESHQAPSDEKFREQIGRSAQTGPKLGATLVQFLLSELLWKSGKLSVITGSCVILRHPYFF